MMKLSIFALQCFVLLTISTTHVDAQSNEIPKKIDSLFSNYSASTPGVAVVIVKDGTTVFKKGYGSANLEYDIPITTQTVFNIASVSKQFTAFAIYLLEKQGKLSFDDDIRKYFPYFPDYEKPIRIKHLLAHTSGIRDQAALLALAGWNSEDVSTTTQILRLASNQKTLNFETGTAFGYSNTAYTMLAEIVAQISKKSFADFTKENIFNPLGMVNTQFYDDYHKIVKNRAYSYEKKGEQYFKRELNFSNPGSSGLMTTAEDMAKWANNFRIPVVGDRELIQNFNAISLFDNNKRVVWAASPGDTTFHAKGQLHWSYKGLRAISHGGHTAGFRAVLTRFPENDFSIITLSNDEHYQMLGKVLPIVEMYLKNSLKEEKNSPAAPNSAQPKKNDPKFVSDPKGFQGTYYSEELSTTYHVKFIDGQLVMTHYRLGNIPLTRIDENEFSGTITYGFEMEFLKSKNKVEGFEISNFGAKKVMFLKSE